MFICKHEVQYYETDRMGITHHSNYVRWMEEARTFFLREIGWPYEKIEKDGSFVNLKRDYSSFFNLLKEHLVM